MITVMLKKPLNLEGINGCLTFDIELLYTKAHLLKIISFLTTCFLLVCILI